MLHFIEHGFIEHGYTGIGRSLPWCLVVHWMHSINGRNWPTVDLWERRKGQGAGINGTSGP
ncbi:hypothetical protein ISCGN_001873 [Ixodes scapularis]